MAQPIRAMQPYNEVALRLAEGQNPNQAGMGRTSAPPIANPMDNGGISKVAANSQPSTNALYQGQSMGQNASTTAPLVSEAVQQEKIAQTTQSDREYRAQTQLNEAVSTMFYANDQGTKTYELGNPEVAARVHRSVAEAKLMKHGLNPQIPFTSNNFAA